MEERNLQGLSAGSAELGGVAARGAAAGKEGHNGPLFLLGHWNPQSLKPAVHG